MKEFENSLNRIKKAKPDPYDLCPVYESRQFILRKVVPEDAEDLLSCYSNPEAQVFFNSDNCTSDFCYSFVNEMKECINEWLDAYIKKQYVRLSIIDRQIERAVGTVEIFNSEYQGLGILRIDINSQYENQKYIGELLCIADNFFYDFGCDRIVTKSIPEATERLQALTNHGYTYYPANSEWKREDYYIKRK